jgi:adenylate cyclase
VAALAGLAAIGVAAVAGIRAGWWLPAVPVAGVWAASGALGVAYVAFLERRERGRMEDLFGRFLERDVAREIWRQRDAFMNDGRPLARRSTVTVLMADLQGYTTAAEKLDPPTLMGWVNAFLDSLARVIGSHGGVVNDYAGDGVMANFGVPIPRTTEAEIARDARNAVDCALAMGEAMRELNQRWERSGLPAGRVRVGIYTGEVVVGMVGSADRLKFTALGDTVNTASRLESYDRESFASPAEAEQFRILVGDTTLQHLDGSYRSEALGRIPLKGKTELVLVHRIRGRDGSGGIA